MKLMSVDWGPLEGGVSGSLVQRNSDGYEEELRRMLRNRRRVDRTPDAVLHVADEEDIRLAVRFASQNGLKVAVRGGGHSYWGAPVRNGGILIDLSALDASFRRRPPSLRGFQSLGPSSSLGSN